MSKTRQIRVNVIDIRLMRLECKKLFLEEHPEYEKKKVTDKILFSSLIRFYLKN